MWNKKLPSSLFRQPYFVITLISFVLLAPILLTGKALFWGIPSLQFIPWWQAAFETLLSGHWPLWNPFLGMGAPLLANYQVALFYPPYWLYLLFYAIGGLAWLAWAQGVVVVFHIILSGVGMAFLVRRLGFGKLAQTISGLAFGFSGFIVARGWFASINAAVAWLPWILLFAYDLVDDLETSSGTTGKLFSRPRLTLLLKLGGVIGLQLLAGHAQLSWYTWLLTGLWVGFWSWQRAVTRDGNKFAAILGVLRGWFFLAVSTFLGAAIAAVQLLPTAEYLFQSQRAGDVEYELAMTYSFWPWRLLGFLAPDLFGSPVTGDYWGYATYWEDAVYIGMLPFLLALGILLGAVFRRKPKVTPADSRIPGSTLSQRSLAVFLLVVIFVSFLLALGNNTPVFPWLYQHIPTFDMFKSPTRFSIWAIFSLALLAGLGAERWRQPTGRALYWTRLSVAGAFAVSIGAGLGWVLLRNIPDFHISFVRAIALAGFWGLGACVLALLAPNGDSAAPASVQRWQIAVVFWVALDLIVSGWGLNPGIELDFYTQPPANLNEVRAMLGDGRVLMPVEDEDEIKFEQYFLFETFDPGREWSDLRATYLPNLNVLSAIPMINNYDPMVPGRYARWMETIAEIGEYSRPDLLDLMAISVIEREDPFGNFGVVFEPRSGDISRATWVPCARFVPDAEAAWQLVLSETVDFGAEVILENAQPSSIQSCAAAVGSAEIISEHPNQVDIQVEAESPGWLVLADTWYPGWQAEVDGQAFPILRANYLFRAVDLPAGTHLVSFSYRPFWFLVGLGLSLLALLGLIVAIWGLQRAHSKN